MTRVKFSLCTTGFKEFSIEDILKISVQIGLDGVEVWDQHIEDYLHRHGSIDGLVNLLNSYQLSIPSISAYTYFSKSEEERAESIRLLNRALELAVRLDCPRVRTFAGHFSSEKVTFIEWDQMIQDLKECLKTADTTGVNVALEIHNNTFADRIESIDAILTEINHPRLSLIFDGFNLFIENINQMEAFHHFYPWIDHVHLKNYYWDHEDWDRSIPRAIFSGDMDHESLVRELMKRKYEGFISLEYFGEKKVSCIRDSLQQLERLGLSNKKT
jgi:3-dehydroshikimate dehydratase